ncbi:MAG TPA: hypothetical protein VGD99_28400 [Anaerolineae bacterium]
MKKLNFNKYWVEIVIAGTGILMLAVAFLSDLIGVGGASGFGLKQLVLVVVGSGLIVSAGVVLKARQVGWLPKFTLLEEAESDVHPADTVPYKQLTREILIVANARSVLTSVLGTMLLVLAVNFAAMWYIDHYISNTGLELVEQKWKILQNMEAPVDWLVLGDSTGNQGVVPEILENELGGTALNLCTIVPMTTLDDALMLDVYIDKFGPPRNLVIVHSYDALSTPMSPLTFAKVPLPWGVSSRYRFSPALISISQQIQIAVARHFPVYFENGTLKTIIFDGLKSPETLFVSRKAHLGLTSKGYMPRYEPRPEDVEDDKEGHLEGIQSEEFFVTDVNIVAVDHIAALAEQHGINVYIVTGPLYEDLYKDEVFQERFAQIQAWWSEAAGRSEYVHYVTSVSTFPSDEMEEVDHATHLAAEQYTENVSSEIMKLQRNTVVKNVLTEY